MPAPRRGTGAALFLIVLAGIFWPLLGCSSARQVRTYQSIVAAGLVEPALVPPPPPAGSGRGAEPALAPWRIEDAKDLPDLATKLVGLLRERRPSIVAFGELYTPWWVPEASAGAQLAHHFLPKIARELGFRDLVLEYLTQDVPDAELAAAARPAAPAPAIEAALEAFYAQDLLPAARRERLRLHKGGYAPTRERRWTLDDLAVRGAPNGRSLRANPHYVDLTAEIKKRSLAKLLKLRSEGKRALWFGGAEVAELEEEIDFIAASAFASDHRRYTATRDAGAMGADLRALGLDREYALVLVLPPSHIQHQGRLNEEQYERLWRQKRAHPRLAWRTVGGSIKIALLLPYERHRITNMDVKVRAGADAD